MKVIYVAGPFRAANQWEQEANIRRAEALALEIWRLGAVALCPHLNTRYFSGALPDDVWLTGDLELLRRCEAVALVDGWVDSLGSNIEQAEAKSLGMPIFYPGRYQLIEIDDWIMGGVTSICGE